MKTLISVCGSDGDDINLTSYALDIAENVGRLIAKRKGVLVCGGRGGIMKAACKGAKDENGITIGILPDSKDEANEFVDIAIPTGLGLARNVLVVKSADLIIALPGQAGTLSEITYALQFGIPIISLKSWDIKGVIKTETIDEAIAQLNKRMGAKG